MRLGDFKPGEIWEVFQEGEYWLVKIVGSEVEQEHKIACETYIGPNNKPKGYRVFISRRTLSCMNFNKLDAKAAELFYG